MIASFGRKKAISSDARNVSASCGVRRSKGGLLRSNALGMLKLSKAYAAYERKVTLQRTVMHRSLCHAIAWQFHLSACGSRQAHHSPLIPRNGVEPQSRVSNVPWRQKRRYQSGNGY